MTEKERYMSTTPFLEIYNRFFSKITDNLYGDWTKDDVHADVKNMLLSAIPKFKTPKFKLYDYDPDVDITDEKGNVISQGRFNFKLAPDEIEIFADLTMLEWMTRQIASIENTEMKYSSSDFKHTSQANHLGMLLKMQAQYLEQNRSAQKLYARRRIDESGYIRPDFGGLGGSGNGN